MIVQSKGAQLAIAAAALAFSAAAFSAAAPAGSSGKAIASTDKVHCYGVHSCKGNGDCKTSENSCKGQNACKGHSFKGMPASECLSSGGTIGDL